MRLRRRKPGAPPAAAEAVLNLGSTASRPRDAERRTRRRLDPWDRSKYLILGSVLFAFFWWQKLNTNPIKSVADGFWETVEKQAWVWVLLALEVLRQLHFLVAEHWSGYYRFWKFKVFGPSRAASPASIRGSGSASAGCCGSCSGCCCSG